MTLSKGENSVGGNTTSGYVTATIHFTIDFDLDHLVKSYFVVFHTVKLQSFLFAHFVLFIGNKSLSTETSHLGMCVDKKKRIYRNRLEFCKQLSIKRVAVPSCIDGDQTET